MSFHKHFLVVPMLVVFGTLAAAAESEKTFMTYRSHPQRILESDYMKRLLALPEWEPFAKAVCAKIDRSLNERLADREKMEQCFPKDVAVRILNGVARQPVSTEQWMSDFMRHVESIRFECYADLDKKELGDDFRSIGQLLSEKKGDWEYDFDGVLAVVLDVDPRPWVSLLEGFREGIDYTFLQRDPTGDFILDVDYKFMRNEISFNCAGLEIPGEKKRYALLFADADRMREQFKAFKSGTPLKVISAGPLEELTFRESSFSLLHRFCDGMFGRKHDVEKPGLVKSLTMSFRNDGGAEAVRVEAETRDTATAGFVCDLFNGAVTVARFMEGPTEGGKRTVQPIRFEMKDNAVFATLDLNEPVLWKLTAEFLKNATEEINAKKTK